MVLINYLVLNGTLETYQYTKPSKYGHTSPSLSVGRRGRLVIQNVILRSLGRVSLL